MCENIEIDFVSQKMNVGNMIKTAPVGNGISMLISGRRDRLSDIHQRRKSHKHFKPLK